MRITKNMLQVSTSALLIFFVSIMLPMTALSQVASNADAASHTQTGTPKIVFKNQTHDFGTVKPKTSLTHEFVFTNQGTSQLIIQKVKAG